MKYREKLGYMILGGVWMLVGMLATALFSPLGAQTGVRDAEFGTITCRRLVVERSSVEKSGRVVIESSLGLGDKDAPYVLIGGSAGVVVLGPMERDNGSRVFLEAYDSDLEQWYIRVGASRSRPSGAYGAYAGFVGVGSEDEKANILMVE